MNLGNILIEKNILPSISDIKNQLKRRIFKLREKINDAVEIDDEIIFKDELEKTQDILKELTNYQGQYLENDLTLTNLHASLEFEYFKVKKRMEDKMATLQKLSEEDVNLYNNTVHKYNLFTNVLESTY